MNEAISKSIFVFLLTWWAPLSFAGPAHGSDKSPMKITLPREPVNVIVYPYPSASSVEELKRMYPEREWHTIPNTPEAKKYRRLYLHWLGEVRETYKAREMTWKKLEKFVKQKQDLKKMEVDARLANVWPYWFDGSGNANWHSFLSPSPYTVNNLAHDMTFVTSDALEAVMENNKLKLPSEPKDSSYWLKLAREDEEKAKFYDKHFYDGSPYTHALGWHKSNMADHYRNRAKKRREMAFSKATEPEDETAGATFKKTDPFKGKDPIITTLIYENFGNISHFTDGCQAKSDCMVVSGNCCQSGKSGVAFAILKQKKEEYWKARYQECKKADLLKDKDKCVKTGKYNVKVACVNSKCVTQPKIQAPPTSGSR